MIEYRCNYLKIDGKSIIQIIGLPEGNKDKAHNSCFEFNNDPEVFAYNLNAILNNLNFVLMKNIKSRFIIKWIINRWFNESRIKKVLKRQAREMSI